MPSVHKDATFHLTLVRQRSCVDERYACDDHARHLPNRTRSPNGEPATPGKPHTNPMPSGSYRPGVLVVDIEEIIIHQNDDRNVIFLAMPRGRRCFPGSSGSSKRQGSTGRIQGQASSRPLTDYGNSSLTHDLLAAAIAALGGRMQDAVIYEVVSHTYRTKVRIAQGDRLIEIPYRVSDAAHLAIVQRLRSPSIGLCSTRWRRGPTHPRSPPRFSSSPRLPS